MLDGKTKTTTAGAARSSFWSACALLLAATLAACSLHADAVGPLRAVDPLQATADRMSVDIQTLASDAYEGRAPGGPGEARTIAYITNAFERAGLRPGADDGDWLQPVDLVRNTISGPVAAHMAGNGWSRELVRGQDLALSVRVPTPHVNITAAPVAFVGHGVYAPNQGIDNYQGLDLSGRVLLFLPGVASAGPQPGEVNSFGNWRAKQAHAASIGAAGMVQIYQDRGVSFETALRTSSTPRLDRAENAQAAPALTGTVSRAAIGEALALAGYSLADLELRAEAADFHPIELQGMTFSAAFDVTVERIRSNNIIGVVPGARRSAESIIFSAHWDHLGRGAPNAAGDNIYNGAIDNALGVAELLEMARRFGAEPPTERSVVFISFTAEEPGLLGSQYYVEHPVFPLETTAAVINFDTGLLRGPTRDISVVGGGKTNLEQSVGEAATAFGRILLTPPDPNADYLRSDHARFAHAGVPAIFVGSGRETTETGERARLAAELADVYYDQIYHTPDDEWSADWDLRGVAQNIDVLHAAGRALAQSSDWPSWSPDVEYDQVRRRSDAVRNAAMSKSAVTRMSAAPPRDAVRRTVP